MRRVLLVAGLAAMLFALAVAPAVGAQRVSQSQFDQLVDESAAGDRQSLEQLRDVDSVAGQPVDMRRALDAEGDELEDRLRALDQGGSGSTGGEPAKEAKEILDGGEYSQTEPPRPFRKPLERVGDWIEDAIDSITFGNSPIGWFVLALLVAGIVGVIAVLISRKRVKGSSGSRGRQEAAAGEDPAELERRADRAEKAGDYSLAVRLRYRAGLLRLGDRQAIEYRPSLTAHQVSDQLDSARYDELASRFEGVAYGEQEASEQDSADAATKWREVVREAKK